AKAALPVAGEALVVRILRALRAAGVTRVVLNLHHRSETITREVGDGSALDLSVRYSWETEVLGSAGGPARAMPLLEADRFLIVNGDTLAGVDLAALAAQHVDTNALVTMAVVDADPRYNAILADESGVVTGFKKSTVGTVGTVGTLGTLGTLGTFHFIGVQAVNAAAFAGVSPSARSETVHGMYPDLIAQRPGRLRVMRTTAEFFDIGTPRDYLDTALKLAAREGRAPDRGHGCAIARDASLTDTILWNNVSIGSGAALTRCIAADGVTVPAGAKHVDCSLVMRDNELVVAPI
ncbi:MAG: sugar phosphate nucleotidyltransferase, partial [Acidobacteriota bacterium]|nr:sugar phosphate nucleotidyltransferase [Acidobacteriota bacterium]